MDPEIASQLFPGDGAPNQLSRPNQAERLVTLAASVELFQEAGAETVFGTYQVNGHRETWRIRAGGFRRWLTQQFYTQDHKPPGAQALEDALRTLEAKAHNEGRQAQVAVRVAGVGGRLYLDLCDATWRMIEIDANGWRVVTESPVRFRRAHGMLPLPEPRRDGRLDELRPLVNVPDEGQWTMLVAWLLGALHPTGPYPVLALHGEHGSTKSTLARTLRALLDPNVAPIRTEPRDERDLILAATNGWVIALDNLSTLPGWLSDALSRLATGTGFGTRTLYSDGDETLFAAARPIVLNGIEEVATRPDLLDRALVLSLPTVAESARLSETAFWKRFDAVRPSVLGALLTAAAAALARAGTVRMTRVPRMADFAQWVTAAAPALGWHPDQFLDAYAGNRQGAHQLALEASVIGPPLWAMMERSTEAWEGTATQLLEALAARTSEDVRKQREWPKTGRGMSGALRRLAPTLRALGMTVTLDRRQAAARPIRLELNHRLPSPPSPEGAAIRDDRDDGDGLSLPPSVLNPDDPRNDLEADRPYQAERTAPSAGAAPAELLLPGTPPAARPPHRRTPPAR